MEPHDVEFKQSWQDEYLKWVCGFANVHGGKSGIGVDDDGLVIGVVNARKLLEDIPNKIRDPMGIVVDVVLRKRLGKNVVEIMVKENDLPVPYYREYHYRTGGTKRLLTEFALMPFLFHKMHLSWDGEKTAGRLAFGKFTFKRLAWRYAGKTGREAMPRKTLKTEVGQSKQLRQFHLAF